MSDTVIKVENLSKKYILCHQKQERYTALRDVISNGARNLGRKLLAPFSTTQPSSTEEFFALKNISFEIKQGDRVGIIGRNGAGKSTLLKILSRITEPTSGRIEITGRVASLLEVGTGFHPELTGRENIYLNGAILGMSRREIKRKFDEIVAFSEVERFLDTPVKHFSSGMYVRLAFAVAAHLEPEILVVDEVLAVGDASFQRKCLGKMGEAAKEGRTVLFVSHNMAAVQSLCSTGFLLEKGEIAKSGSVKPIVEGYLDSASFPEETRPLIERTDRTGDGRLRFTAFRLRSSDGDSLSLACGGNGRIEVEFASSEKRLAHLRFGIVFKDRLSGTKLLDFNTYYESDETFNCNKGNSRIVFEVKKFPLSAGEYSVGLIATSELEVLDWVKEAGSVTVSEGNFYATGRMPLSKGVAFHHECYCHMESL